ncbi:hypothetical protein I3U44_17175 [Mycobacteroides abscessus subsp. bolletii]|uniref:hypothetical protein n=1 Tax=Mycobacteroides abscessus TaxID=36809 RepID=UPI0019D1389A|nr:hypothetical protein [Mycobacteroides abscessus]QSM87561.1 hypothetical protein I3U44_17175 [Mycobacteroides abscessus subsp. bolletii]
MSEYTVYFTTVASSPGITVEADDPEDAINKAWDSDDLPSLGSICHQCARAFDLGGEWEPNAVECDGKVVWSERNE